MLVMRRPIPIATVVILFLLVLGIPFLRLQIGLPDDRVLSPSHSSRQVQDQIRSNFTSNEAGALQVIAPGLADPAARSAAIAAYAESLSRLRGVARVDALTGSYVKGTAVPAPPATTTRFEGPRGTWLSVVPAVEPLSPAGEQLTHDVRDTGVAHRARARRGAARVARRQQALVVRTAALGRAVDRGRDVRAAVPHVRAVVVPIKALVLNVLSLTATFGAIVWIFQDGHLSGFLDFTPTGTLAATMPILMFCVAFGLSMDYEVFLLSRIKEEHDRTRDNVRSVRARARADRAHRHRGRRADQRRVPRVRHVGGRVHQAVRRRARACGAHRRVRDPRHARSRVHAPRR